MIETPYTEKIHYKKINFELAIAHKDFLRANELENELSVLYLIESLVFSESIEEMEKVKKKKWGSKSGIEKTILELREKYTQINSEWKEVQKMRKDYSN